MIKRQSSKSKFKNSVFVYTDPSLESWWSHLQKAQPKVGPTSSVLGKICYQLLKRTYATIEKSVLKKNVFPIYIFRGGLFFLRPDRRINPKSSCGFVIPHRIDQKVSPTIIYVDIPTNTTSQNQYLILDLIVNSGDTAIETLQIMNNLNNREGTAPIKLHLAAAFMTTDAIENILEHFPDVIIHTYWSNMQRDPNGRLTGLGFDGGDYACGGSKRIRHVSLIGTRVREAIKEEFS